MEQTSLIAKFAVILLSLLSTGVYALAIFLSCYFVKKIDFKNFFVKLTPLLGVVLVLLLTPFIFPPLNFIFQKLFDPLLNPGRGILHSLEGLFLTVVLWYIYRSFSKGGDN